MNCYFCKQQFTVNTFCEAGHFICDNCHSKDAKELTLDYLSKTELTDPFQMADEIMKHPKFKIYGPEHHFLVPGVILTTLKNLKVKKPNGILVSWKDVLEGIRRGSTIPGGHCGFFGNCGAGVGTGIVISVFTDANPSTDESRTKANIMTAKSLLKIADNLKHCCKRSVRHSIREALEFLNTNFNIEPKLKFLPKKCEFSEINSKFEKERCPFN